MKPCATPVRPESYRVLEVIRRGNKQKVGHSFEGSVGGAFDESLFFFFVFSSPAWCLFPPISDILRTEGVRTSIRRLYRGRAIGRHPFSLRAHALQDQGECLARKRGFEVPPTLYNLDEDEHLFVLCVPFAVTLSEKSKPEVPRVAWGTTRLHRYAFETPGSPLMDRRSLFFL